MTLLLIQFICHRLYNNNHKLSDNIILTFNIDYRKKLREQYHTKCYKIPDILKKSKAFKNIIVKHHINYNNTKFVEILGMKSGKTNNGVNEVIKLKDIKYHCNNNTPCGIKIKKSLKDEYNIDILNIEIKAGRGHHYDLLVQTNDKKASYRTEFKGSTKQCVIRTDLPPWYNGVQFYNGCPKPFTLLHRYSLEWFNKYFNNDEYLTSFNINNELLSYEEWLKDAFRQGKNKLPFMIEFKDAFYKLKNKKTSMLEERVEFNKSFTISNDDLEGLMNEISPIYEKIMKDKELWLQITGDLENPDNFNVKWTKGMALSVIPELKKVSVKTRYPDIKFNCECDKMCDCLDKHDCLCKGFTFEAHLRWGYGAGFSNLRLDFK
jgi:hypothetical protein